MPSNNQINLPAGYAPAFAIGFSDQSGDLAIVDASKPLPVSLPPETPVLVQAAAIATPPALQGLTGADMIVGPFALAAGKPVVLTLAGQWEGSVQVERSTDTGATRHKLTAGGLPWGLFAGNACEIVWAEEEAGAELYLDITVTSGTISYRIAQ